MNMVLKKEWHLDNLHIPPLEYLVDPPMLACFPTHTLIVFYSFNKFAFLLVFFILAYSSIGQISFINQFVCCGNNVCVLFLDMFLLNF
jgi:hypothetical protein